MACVYRLKLPRLVDRLVASVGIKILGLLPVVLAVMVLVQVLINQVFVLPQRVFSTLLSIPTSKQERRPPLLIQYQLPLRSLSIRSLRDLFRQPYLSFNIRVT